MAEDDDRLLDALGRALVPHEEPSPTRLRSFLTGIGRERRQSRPTPPSLGWLGAGVTVVAAMAVLLVVALPNVLSPPEASPTEAASSTRAAVARLRTALAGGDPIAVAEADADLLRLAGRLPAQEAAQLRSDAVSAHTRAVAFLRDNPAPIEFVPRPAGNGTSVAAPGPTVGSPPAVSASPPTTAVSVPTTVTPAAPRVTIRSVTAELDGSFRVDFATTGFDTGVAGSAAPYAVRFSFDDGQSPTIWTGSAPWVFPLRDGLVYRQVCAAVVDASGAVVASSGGCHPIA